jgi:ABC-type phosphate transport system substrate-binding protein
MKWLSLLCLLFATLAQSASILVHQNVSIESLSQAQLRSIFTLRQTQWPDGSAITVIVMPDSAVLHQRFSREKLKLFPYQLNSIWDKHSFSGTGTRPVQAEDVAAMLQLLRTTPGAIGYVDHFTTQFGIKEVRIDY